MKHNLCMYSTINTKQSFHKVLQESLQLRNALFQE